MKWTLGKLVGLFVLALALYILLRVTGFLIH